MAPPGSALVASWYVCLIPPAPLIVLRLRSRWKTYEKLAIDDYVFIVAIFAVLGFNATVAQMWNQGLSNWKAGYLTSEDQIVAIMKMVLPSKTLYISATWAIKFSVVLFYRMVAPRGSRVVAMSYVAMSYLVVSWAGAFFFTLFGCRPYDRYWSGDPSYQCPAAFTLISWLLLTGLNISTNILVVFFPIPMVKKLDMRLRDKFAIGFMFILGFVIIAASIMQAYYNKQNNIMLAATASMVELSAGLIGTSLLALCNPILGKNAFRASTASRRHHGLATAHHQAHLNELKLLEVYKNEKNVGIRRSLSTSGASGANGNSMNSILNSQNRTSTTSKDSLVLPGQFHIGVGVDRRKNIDEAPGEDDIERITVCADIDELYLDMKSETESMRVKSPAPETWI